MHRSSFNEMGLVLRKYLASGWDKPLRVLDVGSRAFRQRHFRHTYREVISPAWVYTGSDIEPGRNVDLVQEGPYTIRREPSGFDVVISGQVLEHVPRPWELVREMHRMLVPGGWAFLVAPWEWPIHAYPVDCWRVLPDGMAALLDAAGFRTVETYTRKHDCWGIGTKPLSSKE